MHLSPAEVAPAAPALVEALGPLLALTALLFALGCATLITYFVQAFLGALGSVFSIIPGVGGVTAGVIHSVENAVVSALGKGISKIEGAIGHQWHNLSRVLDHLWSVIVRMAEVSWEIAKLTQGLVGIGTITHWLNDLRSAIKHALNIGTRALHRVTNLEKTVTKSVAQ